MVHNPRMTREPDGELVVWDVAEARPARDWRFLGWLLIGATIVLVLYDIRGWQFVENTWEYLLPLLTAVAGAVLIAVGRSVPLIERPLLKVTPTIGGPELEAYLSTGREKLALHELTHIVFGMIDYPWPDRKDVNVEAFALYLATESGRPVPIIDGTMEKMAAYRIGQALSQMLGIPMIEMGKGQQ